VALAPIDELTPRDVRGARLGRAATPRRPLPLALRHLLLRLLLVHLSSLNKANSEKSRFAAISANSLQG
jgi:hypothetical protein